LARPSASRIALGRHRFEPRLGGGDAHLHVDQLVAHRLVSMSAAPKVLRSRAQASASS
jgi:hypothetical protein